MSTGSGAGGSGGAESGGGSPARRSIFRSQTFIGWVGVAAAVAVGIIPLVLQDKKDDKSADPPPPAPTAISTLPSPPSPSSPPDDVVVTSSPSTPPVTRTPSATSTPSSTPGSTPNSTPSGSGIHALDNAMTGVYDIEVPHRHYLDIDAQAISDTPNRAHDLDFFSGWIRRTVPGGDQGTSPLVEIGVIDDANVPKCATRSRRIADTMFLGTMKETQSLCVLTSERRWALLQVADATVPEGGAVAGGSVVFHIGFLKNP